MQGNCFPIAGRVALRSVLPLVSEDAPRRWIHMAYEGEWQGHHAGAFAFTPDVFRRVVRNFSRQSNRVVPLTYEHPDYAGDGRPVPAAGWVHELEVRSGTDGAELWGLVEFTPTAAKMARDGEYRFVSVVVDFNSRDRGTGDDVGPELLEVGLTNVPFLDGLEPIRLSRRACAGPLGVNKMEDKDLILAAIKALGESVSLERVATWVTAKRKLMDIESGEPEGTEEVAASEGADDDEDKDAVKASRRKLSDADAPAAVDVALEPAVEAAAVDLAAVLETIAAASGLEVPAVVALMQEKPEDIGQFLAQLAVGEPAQMPAEGEMTSLSRKLSLSESTINILRKQVDVLSAERLEREKHAEEQRKLSRKVEAEAAVDEAIASGIAADAERDNLIWLHTTDPERFVAMLSTRGPAVPVGKVATSKGPEHARGERDWREHPDYQVFDLSLRASRMKQFADPKVRHDKVVEELQKLAAKNDSKQGRN